MFEYDNIASVYLKLYEETRSLPKLYHISFDDSLEKTWTPMNPAGDESENKKSEIAEPDLPRISCSPSIHQCFQAIYQNIGHYFTKEKFPNMDFYVYEPQLNKKHRVLTPTQLQDKHYVHDAHITQEHCILDPVYMKKTMKVRIQNTNSSPMISYYPFDDPKFGRRDLAPSKIKYAVLRNYE